MPKYPTKVVLENEKQSRSVNLERFSADFPTGTNARALPSWNLSVFRYPEHPEFGKVKPAKQTKYLVLEFSTVAGDLFKPLTKDNKVRLTRDSEKRFYRSI